MNGLRLLLRAVGMDCRPSSRPPSRHDARQIIHDQVDHRRRVKGEQLRHDQAADNGDAERLAQLEAGPVPIAIGTALKIAPSMVMVIGRSRAASRIASRAPSCRLVRPPARNRPL